MPVFLRNTYRFYLMTLLDTTCIIAEIIEETSGIDAIKKYIMRIEELTNLQAVFYHKDITRYRRKRLIENRIAFVIEDGQMFLPFLGLNLKKAPEYVEKKLIKFSTSTQVAYMNRDIVKDEKLVELQIWDYDPNLFANKGHVDRMSLYASLKEENDERVEQALEELLTDEDQHFLFELIKRRHDNSSTIFCTQFKKDDWHTRLGGVHADTMMNRIVHNALSAYR